LATQPAAASPLETVGLCVLAVLVLLGIILLAGAHLAAAVAGRAALHADLGDAATALVRLPATPGDPAAAWGPAGRAALPGPVLYYVSLGAVLLVAAGMGTAGWRLWRMAARGQHPLGVEPHAGLARGRDLRRLCVRSPEPGRLSLGLIGRRLIAAERQVSLAVVGPTGCGKTAGFAIPALLEWDGPVICTSVKTDLLEATLARRRDLGRVWVYDPSGSAHQGCSGWSPLSACGTWAGAIRMTAWLCEASQARLDTVTDGDYWYTQARKALAPHLYAAAVSGRTMRDVVRWVDAQEQEPIRAALRHEAGITAAVEAGLAGPEVDNLRAQIEPRTRAEVVDGIRQVLRADPGRKAAMADQRTTSWPIDMQDQLEERVAMEVDLRVRRALELRLGAEAREGGRLDALVSAESLWTKEDRLRDSVYATIQNVLLCYADPDVAAAADSCDIDLGEWLAGPNTIYVVATADEQARLRPVLTVLIQAAIRRAYEEANAKGGSLWHPCLVLLDEAGNIAPLRDLPGYAATARSHGISLVTVWQDLAQISAIYGDRARTVLNNHRAKIFGGGTDDEDTLDYVSRLVGDYERVERSYSADVGGGRRSVSEHTALRRTLPADVLRRMPSDTGLLIYGSQLPAHLRLRPWFEDDELRALAGPPFQGGGPQGAAVQRQLPPWRKLHSL
jgi:type IV secretion system protein VirD4